MNERKKAVAYIRISSTKQINNESPETQRTMIADYANRNNIEILEWFYDEAKSGKNTDREELQNLLKYALKYKGKIDHVIVYKITRAGRDLVSYVTTVKAILNSKGITLRSATEPIDDTVSGRFMEGLLMLVGQLDNETKAEYTKDNMKALALQGYWQHPPIVGYSIHKIPNELGKLRPTLKPNAMGEKVSAVLTRFSKGDISKAELTRYAAKIGLRSRYGKKLTEDRINRLLINPTYAGYVADKFTEYQPVEGKHPSLISPQIYERNQSLLNRYKNSRVGEIHSKANEIYAMRGFLLDINCSKPMYASAPKSGSGKHYPRYHCSRPECRGKSKSVTAEAVHSQFVELLERLEPSKPLLKLFKTVLIRKANTELDNLNTKIRTLRDRLDSISESRSKAIQKFVDGALTPDEKKDVIDSLDQQKLDISYELQELEQRQAIREADIEYAINFMRDLRKLWEDSDYEIRQRFQKMIFPEGVFYDSINHRFGTSTISPLYRYISKQKGSEEPSKYHLVAGGGLEPPTLWL